MTTQTGHRSKFARGLFLFMLTMAYNLSLEAAPATFRLTSKQLIVVPVLIDGTGPYDFLLDTGTNTTVVDPSLGKKLNLQVTDRLELINVAGRSVVPSACLDRVSVAGTEARRVETLIADLSHLQRIDLRIRGILGQNFLTQFSYLIDYQAKKIEFDPSGEVLAALQGTRTPFESMEGLMVVKSDSARFLLDSGASHLILFTDRPLNLQGAKTSPMDFMQISDVIFRNLPFALVEPAAQSGPNTPDGLLPMSLFRTVYVNQRDDFVMLNPMVNSGRH